MNVFSKTIVAFTTLLSVSSVFASIPNHESKTTFLGPTAKVSFTSTIGDDNAYTFAGEAGVKNYRLGGTVAWKVGDDQRVKASAEWLWQKINYAYFDGNVDSWVQQGAVGVGYQHDIAGLILSPLLLPQFDANGYLSHGYEKGEGVGVGTFINRFGVITPYRDVRRITLSNGIGVSPGLTIRPWNGARLSAAVNYDHVGYDKNYDNPNGKDAHGFGGTVRLKQVLFNQFILDVSGAYRAPFDTYSAELDWAQWHYCGDWKFGVFSDYTIGKHSLPDTWDIGLSAEFYLDLRQPKPVAGNLKGEVPIYHRIKDNLLAWTSEPAVYMPQVLVLAEEKVTVG